MKTTVYVVSHKPTTLVSQDPIYKVLQVGAVGKEHFSKLSDDSGDNISKKNQAYCELTGMYWIWKNDNSDIVGLCHYRRYFASAPGWLLKQVFGINKCILSKKKIEKILTKYDVILNKSNYEKIYTVEEIYKKYHHIEDLTIARSVIKEKCPEYLETFDQIVKHKAINTNNALICKKELFDRYAEWLFSILDEVEKRVDSSSYSEYQKRVFGFLSERLMRVWFVYNKINIKEIPLINTEDPCYLIWLKKCRKDLKTRK